MRIYELKDKDEWHFKKKKKAFFFFLLMIFFKKHYIKNNIPNKWYCGLAQVQFRDKIISLKSEDLTCTNRVNRKTQIELYRLS